LVFSREHVDLKQQTCAGNLTKSVFRYDFAWKMQLTELPFDLIFAVRKISLPNIAAAFPFASFSYPSSRFLLGLTAEALLALQW
jgi:hypothetical protein